MELLKFANAVLNILAGIQLKMETKKLSREEELQEEIHNLKFKRKIERILFGKSANFNYKINVLKAELKGRQDKEKEMLNLAREKNEKC